ncbi:hypothetical protein EOD39_18564 [Acipenser ruthenus]|uniref:Uncharacterized protein n=1 Tax=Acipenser ruthenus TaxID=7906 RepID=A0A444V0F4_ACIRT|nr:hypothetical protein EOD39_18564 [Acipenser ruthenus]
MAAVVHFLMQEHLALVEERQEHVQRRRARRRRPCIFNPRVTLFGMPEDTVLKRYRLAPQVILDLIAELKDEQLDPSINLGTAISAHDRKINWGECLQNVKQPLLRRAMGAGAARDFKQTLLRRAMGDGAARDFKQTLLRRAMGAGAARDFKQTLLRRAMGAGAAGDFTSRDLLLGHH